MTDIKNKTNKIYRIKFLQMNQVYVVHAKKVSHGEMMGFVELNDLIFMDKSSVIANPTEEALRSEFEGVDRVFVPLQAVIRIDEVKSLGHAYSAEHSLSLAASNVIQFPGVSGS